MSSSKNKQFFTIQIALLSSGVTLTVIGILGHFDWKEIMLNIGIALIAASLVSLFNKIFSDDDTENKIKPTGIDSNLGLVEIYKNRSDKNEKINRAITELAPKIDIMTQDGLHLLREKMGETIKARLMDNLEIRVLIPIEIKEQYHRDNINDLIDWYSKLNKIQRTKMSIRRYNGTPQDLYFHIKNIIIVGPYFYDLKTDQTTITYEFEEDSYCGKVYSEFFERIWDKSEEIKIDKNEKTRINKI
jgi:hypothetical protein